MKVMNGKVCYYYMFCRTFVSFLQNRLHRFFDLTRRGSNFGFLIADMDNIFCLKSSKSIHVLTFLESH